VLGGTNSLHTNALDETLALPSEQAAEIALRTQQVIMEETGVVNVADPLGGSWYVEALTDQIEAEANAIFDKILAMGGSTLTSADVDGLASATRNGENPVTRGLLRGIEDGWFMSEIAEAAFQYQVALEKGEKRIVGVNCHEDSVTHELEILRVSHEVEVEQVRELVRASYDARRGRRDGRASTDGRGRTHGRQHDRADARGLPGRGHPGRDLRRAARRVGRVPGARALLGLSPRWWPAARPTIGAWGGRGTGPATAFVVSQEVLRNRVSTRPP
jgi:hypothetical protein